MFEINMTDKNNKLHTGFEISAEARAKNSSSGIKLMSS